MSDISSTNSNATTNNSLAKSRRALILIVSCVVFVIVSATILYRLAISGGINLPQVLGTSNYGVLVAPPRQLDDVLLLDEQNQPIKLSSLPAEWNFVVANDGSCPKACVDTLYLTRQLRKALGADSLRVRLVLISKQMPIDQTMHAFIQQEHEKLEVLYTTPSQFDKLFANAPAGLDPLAANTFYLVDPQGWLMMSYNQNNTYKEILKDMRFLLKNSSQ
jgi:cytochrome oxidase Cu insertion factor (SCO1/SenC/PrrC family)